MNRTRAAAIVCIAVFLLALPGPGYGLTAEDWLRKGREEADPQSKIECFDNAIRLNPGLAEVYAYRGMAYSDLGKYDKAVADYTRAIDLNPDNPQTYNNRGWARDRLGQYDKAVADYSRAIGIDPHYSSAYNNRGVTYYNQGQIDKALADFDKACKLGYPKGCENYYKIK